MPALEDKLVQRACAKRLTAIDEPEFLDGRDGYRPGRGALDAGRDLTCDLQDGRYGSLGEAEVKGFFEHRDHTWLMDMVRVRIDDRALLHLIRTWLKAGIVDTDGQGVQPETGTPQGGTSSPMVSKVCLHRVVDAWLVNDVQPRKQGRCLLTRFADDFILGCA